MIGIDEYDKGFKPEIINKVSTEDFDIAEKDPDKHIEKLNVKKIYLIKFEICLNRRHD
jgi:hypothetical protein